MTGVGRRRRRRTGRVAIAAAVVLVVGATAAAATGFGFDLTGGGARGEPDSGLPPATATMHRQTLVDTQTESGELGYGDTTTVTERAGGTVTALAETGSTVERGETLYRVDNEPVVLLYGSLPAYRSLSVGIEGSDVKQLERNLSALGYEGFTVDAEYTDATASAVEQWQEDLGLAETGTVELGRVVYAPERVRIDAHEAAVGDAIQPGAAILTYEGTSPVVIVDLDVADQRLASEDAAVEVTLPDGTSVEGTVAGTRTVIETAEGEQTEPETIIEVTVTVGEEEALAGLDQASVEVAFTTSQREDVLTVPVAALLALAEGGYGVEVVESTTTRIVAVHTGLFAGGRVEISGEGLSEGMTVGMPS